jgi:dimethylaniline monooxygenase (N-oxide forming)
MAPLRVAVIGAGPAGLVTLKYLVHAHEHFDLEEPIDARLFASGRTLGGGLAPAYEDAEMVSSKYLSAFSDFRLPASEPDFLPIRRYVQYLDDYADRFGLRRFMQFDTLVCGVLDAAGGRKEVVGNTRADGLLQPLHWTCDAVAVCTGLNGEVARPGLVGWDRVRSLPASVVFSRADFPRGGTVAVMGAGEMGLDMAWLAVTSRARRVVLCHRDGFFTGPKVGVSALSCFVPCLLPLTGRRPDCALAHPLWHHCRSLARDQQAGRLLDGRAL